ncbi:MAG TPA: alpha/beta hydrolase [Cyclobacteriaceae bacterium]
MKELFLLSGLGADERVFTYLDLSGYKLHYIKWISPQKNESIQHYASRLLEQIKSPNPILIGVSFGGMMAIEIGKQITTAKIILVSSVQTCHDLPFTNGLISKLKLHRILPLSLPQKIHTLMFWLFGVTTDADKKLLRKILDDTDTRFSDWAIDKIITWNNEIVLNNVIHIHGTADRMLPLKHADYTIANGGHFMIVNRAAEISKIVREELGFIS